MFSASQRSFQRVSLDGIVFIYRIGATTYIIVYYYTNIVQLLISVN